MLSHGDSLENRTDNEIYLANYWHLIIRERRLILLIVGGITLLSLAISLLMPVTYQGKATIMPVVGGRGGGMGSMVSAQLGIRSIMSDLEGMSSPSSQIIAVLRSRTLAEKMIEKYGLMPILYSDLWDENKKTWNVSGSKIPLMEDAVKTLFLMLTFTDSKKEQLIIVTAESKNPKFAADLINSYIKELASFIQEKTLTAAKRNRIFLERQLERNKVELLQSGIELSNFYSKNKVSNQAAVDVDVSIAPYVQEETPLGLSEAANSKVQALIGEVQSVNNKIQQAQIVKNVPQQIYFQYLTLRRDLLAQVNTLLTQQYEIAKTDEAKENLNFQVIDWAKAPVRKYKPKRKQIVITAFLISIFLGFFTATLKESLTRPKRPA